MSTFSDVVVTNKLTIKDEDKDIDIFKYLPYAVEFQIGELSSTTTFRDISVPIKDMGNTNYGVWIKTQNNISFNTEAWLTAKVISKATDHVNLRIYNEQKHDTIQASTWSLLVVPYR